MPRTQKYNTSTFSVMFQPLPATNGPITKYELKVEQKKDDTTVNTAFVSAYCAPVKCHESATSHDCIQILQGLKQCATYSIRVRAYTAKGLGPYSDETSFLTSGIENVIKKF